MHGPRINAEIDNIFSSWVAVLTALSVTKAFALSMAQADTSSLRIRFLTPVRDDLQHDGAGERSWIYVHANSYHMGTGLQLRSDDLCLHLDLHTPQCPRKTRRSL
jgi:hypothetical protein